MSDEENAAKPAPDKRRSSDQPFSEPAPENAPELVAAAEQPPTEEEIAKAAADEKATATKTAAKEGGGIVMRRSRWYSSLAALRYVSSLSKDDDLRVRDSDRATSIFLLISSILTVVSLLLKPLAQHRLPLVLVCDALVGVMLVFYVANRFGILNTLTPRQALLTWQLMMGASFLGIFLTINMAVMIALIVANTNIEIPH